MTGMTNPLFLDFIRKQVAAGISRPDIEKVLKINGLTPAEIEESFSAALSGASPVSETHPQAPVANTVGIQATPTPAAPEINVQPPVLLARPQSMTWFEVLMYASIAFSIYLSLGAIPSLSTVSSIASLALAALSLVFFSALARILLVYAVARRAQIWAFIVLCLLVILSSISTVSVFVIQLLNGDVTSILYRTGQLLPFLLEITAIGLLLFTNARSWLFGHVLSRDDSGLPVNKFWIKVIPRTNTLYLLVCGVLFILVDSMILAANPELFQFWAFMAGVLVIFLCFYYFENTYSSKKLSSTQSPLDSWIFALIMLRNIVFVLNLIRLIQLIGMMALAFFGIPYLIGYALLFYYRFKVR